MQYVNAFVLAILAAIATAGFGFFKGDIAVHVANLVTQGSLGGHWRLETREYERKKPSGSDPQLVTVILDAELQQLGFRVLGKLATSSNGHTNYAQWDASGYQNGKFLALSYVSATGGSGLGAFTLYEGAEGLAFSGYWSGAECEAQYGADNRPLPDKSLLMMCPAIMFRSDRPDLETKYSGVLASQCQEILVDKECKPKPIAEPTTDSTMTP
jgi:hypothetical protein